MLYPLGKYLVVEPIEEEKQQVAVLVPEDVEVDARPYKLVTIVEPNANSILRSGMKVLVPAHLLEQASFFGETYYLITENNVIGFYSKE
tara:strand:+ start:1445 stop:1711 length:267 start_codon:yes stop_codon:yes gene_type:complete